LTSEDPYLQSQNQAGDLRHPQTSSDILRHQTRLPEVPAPFPGVKKAAATEETAPKRPKAAPPKASKASKASSESSDESGKDAKDGQKDDAADAADAVEVKDAETLWKVNIEAVYRRKNP